METQWSVSGSMLLIAVTRVVMEPLPRSPGQGGLSGTGFATVGKQDTVVGGAFQLDQKGWVGSDSSSCLVFQAQCLASPGKAGKRPLPESASVCWG